jgi:hypothetical protein
MSKKKAEKKGCWEDSFEIDILPDDPSKKIDDGDYTDDDWHYTRRHPRDFDLTASNVTHFVDEAFENRRVEKVKLTLTRVYY